MASHHSISILDGYFAFSTHLKQIQVFMQWYPAYMARGGWGSVKFLNFSKNRSLPTETWRNDSEFDTSYVSNGVLAKQKPPTQPNPLATSGEIYGWDWDYSKQPLEHTSVSVLFWWFFSHTMGSMINHHCGEYCEMVIFYIFCSKKSKTFDIFVSQTTAPAITNPTH